jgi:hypothetical protein
MLIGYARVSSQDQNLELQTEALTKAGCKNVFEDKVTGSRAERPGLVKAQEAFRDGDTLVVWKLDRLGRSVKNLVDLVGDLHKQGAEYRPAMWPATSAFRADPVPVDSCFHLGLTYDMVRFLKGPLEERRTYGCGGVSEPVRVELRTNRRLALQGAARA